MMKLQEQGHWLQLADFPTCWSNENILECYHRYRPTPERAFTLCSASRTNGIQ